MAKGYVSVDLDGGTAEVWVEESTGPTTMDADDCMALATQLVQAAQVLTLLRSEGVPTARTIQGEVDRIVPPKTTPRPRPNPSKRS